MSMRWEPQALNYSHEALVDLLMVNPAATNAELGAKFGRTAQWVMLVKSSGLFREAYALRLNEVADPLVKASIEERLEMLTARSLDVVMEKLARPAADIPDNLAIAAAQLGAKASGLGGFSSKPPPAPSVAQPDRIARLADRLLNLGKVEAQEVSFIEMSPGSAE